MKNQLNKKDFVLIKKVHGDMTKGVVNQKELDKAFKLLNPFSEDTLINKHTKRLVIQRFMTFKYEALLNELEELFNEEDINEEEVLQRIAEYEEMHSKSEDSNEKRSLTMKIKNLKKSLEKDIEDQQE